ncbi:hypothetical protein PPUN110474_33190 [Pseudomonas putida]|nr:hypothetical protein PPUN110474_33190 [Pseudomonas putida]
MRTKQSVVVVLDKPCKATNAGAMLQTGVGSVTKEGRRNLVSIAHSGSQRPAHWDEQTEEEQ